jgi:competence protein ComEA
MTPLEGRGLLKGALLLLVLAAARAILTGPPGLSVLPDGRADNQLPVLLEEARETRDAQSRRSEPLGAQETMDPNRSGEEELDRLPGVGPRVAEAIIRHRAEKGGFRRPEDLLDVPGIGPATLARIRPHLDLSRGVPVELRSPGMSRELLDLNRAGIEELQELPGIGPALAVRILESRSRDGRFEVPEDLLRVRGIGPATLDRLRPLIRVGR